MSTTAISMKHSASLQTSVCDGIARLTLSRPEKRNAFDDTMIAGITTVLKEWSARDDIRVLVIAAEGETFCAGADLNWMKRTAQLDYDANLADAHTLAEMMDCLDRFPAPVMTLVQGGAFGGALGIICASDIVLATEDAKFCLSEVKLGIMPAVISPYVIRAMGERQARRYMLTAEVISAQAALAMGVVHQLFGSREEAEEKSRKMIRGILANGPAATAACKQLIADVQGKDIDDELVQFTSRAIAEIRNTPEGQEGLGAFLEKRSPSWQEK